jgi:exopolysaccharide biosynthesis protein
MMMQFGTASIFISLLLLFSPVSGQFTKSKPVGPGVVYHHEFRTSGPWHIHVLEIDLSVTGNRLETILAQDKISGREKTSSMVARNDYEGHRVIGAINGDFFEVDGTPVGAQVLNGLLIKRAAARSILGITFQNRPFINIVSFQGRLHATDGSSCRIDDINETRDEDELILYNKYFGSHTATNRWGTEVVAAYISQNFLVNDTVYVKVMSKDNSMDTASGNNEIPPEGIVLSGHGQAAAFLKNSIFVNDTLALVLQLAPHQESISNLVGGTPRLICNGSIAVDWIEENVSSSFAENRHPRSAVAISRDSTKIYFFTIDGRQPGFSVGMSLYELANYMLEWPVYQGMNLDGGGSATMVVRGEVVNSPCDTEGERAVANALMIINSEPTGPLADLLIKPQSVHLKTTEQLHFRAYGFDRNYHPIDLNGYALNWDCKSVIGNINEDGLFTAATRADSGFISVQYKEFIDSTLVYIESR